MAFACGCILLVSVALKVQGLATGTGQPLAVFAPWVQLSGMQAEALVGLWLLVGVARHGAWLAGLVLFTILAAVSVYLIAAGQKSCGCFGQVEVSPWASLALDLACVAALLLARPLGGIVRASACQACFVAATVGLIAVLSSTDVASRQLARLRGAAILLPSGDADVGGAPSGETRTITVAVENVTDEPIRLIGGTTSCVCASTVGLPQTVPARSRVDVTLVVRFTGDVGLFVHDFEWFTDSPKQPRVGGRITGHVLGVRAEQPAK